MQPDDVDYALPEALIARFPSATRSASRLLCVGRDGALMDRQFVDLPQLLAPGDLLVFNDTRVLHARLHGRKASGGRVEVLLERLHDTHRARAQVRASHAPRPGSTIVILDDDGIAAARAAVEERDGRFFELVFDAPVASVMHRAGHVPLPPYIDRDDQPLDRERYQTVYAAHPGAVAAPTAGLHFDSDLLAALSAVGIEQAFVTLHVAAGTFQPLSAAALRSGTLHREAFVVDASVCERVRAARARGGRVVAVGTTSLRALESAALDGALQPTARDTDLFIRPGFEFRVVDGLVTNFHLPRSSLMMLVAAFAGHRRIMDAYAHAVHERYRFFSYGDAMLLWRQPTSAVAS